LIKSRIKVTSTIALHSTLNISKPLEIEAWFQKTTIGNDPNTLKAQYLENYLS